MPRVASHSYSWLKLVCSWGAAPLASLLLLANLGAQDCNNSTGAAGGVTGTQCQAIASAICEPLGPLPEQVSLPPFWGEGLIRAEVVLPPGATSTLTDVQTAMGLVSGGGLVAATGGEFRQTVGLLRTYGLDRAHPFLVTIGYRSYEVDAWRTAGDKVGTIDDPFGPGWRASWGDLLEAPQLDGSIVWRVDEHGARWMHTQLSTSSVNVGPADQSTTWRTYDSQSSTRLVLEYHYVGG